EEQRAVRRLGAGRAQPRVDVALNGRRQAEPAEALGEVHPREALVVLRAAELDRLRGLRIVLGEELVDERVDACEVVHGDRAYRGYFVVAMPPSTGITAPVTYAPARLAR